MQQSNTMTIGRLSARTGVPIKALREYERLGFLYTLGRSDGNYRLFGDETLWCVRLVQDLRALGLTLKEIHALLMRYSECQEESLDALLDAQLTQAGERIEARIAELQALRRRIREVQVARARSQPLPAEQAALERLLSSDPRHR